MQIDIGTIITVGTTIVAWASTVGYLRAKIDNLTEQVKKQNGSIEKLQDWQLRHLEDCHSK